MIKVILAGILISVPAIVQANGMGWGNDGVVTSSSGTVSLPADDGGVAADYPVAGATGVINSYVFLTDPDEAINPDFSGWLPVYVTGSFRGENWDLFEAGFGDAYGTWVDRITVSPTSVAFHSGDITVSDGIAKAEETLYGSFGFTFSPALTTTTPTWGDLSTALSAGQLFSWLSFSGTANDQPVYFAAGEILPEPAPVPLPASALLLVAGLAGLARFRRCRNALPI